MIISTYHERETAVDPGVIGAVIWVLQRACRNKGVVVCVESDRAELLPVPYKGLFREDLVQRYFCLSSMVTVNIGLLRRLR